MIKKSLCLFVLGFLGAAVGGIVALIIADAMTGGTDFYSSLESLVAIVVGGSISLLVTYGLAILFHVPEADLIKRLFARIRGSKGRHVKG